MFLVDHIISVDSNSPFFVSSFSPPLHASLCPIPFSIIRLTLPTCLLSFVHYHLSSIEHLTRALQDCLHNLQQLPPYRFAHLGDRWFSWPRVISKKACFVKETTTGNWQTQVATLFTLWLFEHCRLLWSRTMSSLERESALLAWM